MTDQPTNMRPVLVGVDDSDSARDAALWAAELATLWRVPLRLLHVVDRADPTKAVTIPPWLQTLASTAERLGAEPVEAEIREGSPAEHLLDRAAQARLLVLGSYGAEGWSGALVGTNALRLVEGCTCPLVVVRGRTQGVAPPRGGPVVVGVDGTAASVAALRFAAELASHTQHRRLVTVHTWSEVVADSEGHPYRLDEDVDKLAARAGELLDSYLGPVVAEHPGLAVERRIVQDTPLRALLEQAEDAWLVVVGQRRGLVQPGIRAGSTSRGLVEFAPCPVAVIAPSSAQPHQPGTDR